MKFLAQLAEEEREDLPVLRSNAQNPERDRRGESSSILRYPLRRLAIASYWCDDDVLSFRKFLAESSDITLALYVVQR